MSGYFNNSIRTINTYNNLNQQIQNSIYRLSTGNAIATASDNIAALALGTNLGYHLAGIQAGLTNISQANSLLQVASGGYSQVTGIIGQLQSLATQATSGSLSASDRANLNTQFQTLSSQINSIAGTTNFNGIDLINGKLGNSSIVTTNTSNNATAASGIVTLAQPLANGDTINVTTSSGQTVSFLGNNTGSFTHPLLEIDTTVYTTAAAQATQIASQISQIKNYSGSDATVLSAKQALCQLNISNSGSGQLTITDNSTGTIGNSISVSGSAATASNLLLNNVNAANNLTQTLGGVGTAGTNGALNAGTFSSGATAYSGTATTIASGAIGDSIIKPLTTTVQATTGIDTSGVSNNSAFAGTISGFSATYVSANLANISVTVGSDTYTANSVNTNFTSDSKVTFTSQTAGGGSFQVQFAANSGTAVSNQSDANTYAARLNSAFSTVTFEQNRILTNYTGAGYVYPTGSTTPSGDLSGSSFNLIGSNFGSNPQISKISVTASGAGNAVIQITIGGDVYQSGYNADGSTTNLGNTITNVSGSGANGKIGFVDQSNPNNVLVLNYTSATNVSLSTTAQAQGFQNALENAFGIGSNSANNNNTGISFQTGTSSNSIIKTSLPGVTTNDLFRNSGGTLQTLDISTIGGASAAQTILTNAANYVLAAQAQVGSQEQSLNYAQANLQSSQFNLQAAQNNYLSTDVASESQNLSQLMLRSQITSAVLLAQNNLSSSLLKLLDK